MVLSFFVKHYPDLNFSSLDIEEVKKEMLTFDTKVDARGEEGDAGNVIPVSSDATVV